MPLALAAVAMATPSDPGVLSADRRICPLPANASNVLGQGAAVGLGTVEQEGGERRAHGRDRSVAVTLGCGGASGGLRERVAFARSGALLDL